MKKPALLRSILLTMVIWANYSGITQEYSRYEILDLARNTVESLFPVDIKVQALTITLIPETGVNRPYHVCQLSDTGFVLVSKKQRSQPVLAFSWTKPYPCEEESTDPFIISFINRMTEYLDNEYIVPHKSVAIPASLQFPPIGALISTQWKHDNLFGAQFPSQSLDNASAVIAMGQLFRYWGFPSTGQGEYCYNHMFDGEICLNFSSRIFEFDQMHATIGNIHAASLLYCMAVACHLQPTGASLNTFIHTLPVHFGYSKNMRKVSTYEPNLKEVVLHQLALRRPVPAEWSGFSFLIDGYLALNYFHLNMGRGGLLDGYYDLDFPNLTTTERHLLTGIYVNYHPESRLPAPVNLSMATTGNQLRIGWEINLPDSLKPHLKQFIILKDGITRITQTSELFAVIDSADLSPSGFVHCIADFGERGASELSAPIRYLTDNTPANIQSQQLRNAINIILGYGADLYRQPLRGELEMIKELQVDFADLRGLEQLTELNHLRAVGSEIRNLPAGNYLRKLKTLWFLDCTQLDQSIFQETNGLLEITGRQGLPHDFYDLRHNSDVRSVIMSNHDELDNQLTDLYRFDKYFTKVENLDLYHSKEPGMLDPCYISIESWTDFIPNIAANQQLLVKTTPSVFVPCYPFPPRDTNMTPVNEISWYSNPDGQAGVFYNVFIGEKRNQLDLKGVFINEPSFDFDFAPNKDYYWRVEAYHRDTTYFSGLFHFSTYEKLPVPWTENFDGYFEEAEINEHSTFWESLDQSLTARAITTREIKRGGFYSLKLVPQSDAALLVDIHNDNPVFLDFYVLNTTGNLKIELLQADASGNNAVNTYIRMSGNQQGTLVTSQASSDFTYLPDEWNRLQIQVNHLQGTASLMVNNMMVKEWNWSTAMTGAENRNPLKGIRFFNEANPATGSAYLDDFRIFDSSETFVDNLSSDPTRVLFIPASNQLLITHIDPDRIKLLTLVDMAGREHIRVTNPGSQPIQISSGMPDGIYLVKLEFNQSAPVFHRIAIFR